MKICVMYIYLQVEIVLHMRDLLFIFTQVAMYNFPFSAVHCVMIKAVSVPLLQAMT